MLKPRFFIQAIGPQGGSQTKTGVQTVRAFLFHEEADASLKVEAFMQDGVPHVRVFAFRSGKSRTLFEGPMDALAQIDG